MIVLILLTIFALVILAFGFLGIKIPFITPKQKIKQIRHTDIRTIPRISEKIVKDSIENTVRETRFFRERIKENAV